MACDFYFSVLLFEREKKEKERLMDFYNNFKNISITIHILTGFAFFWLGVSETISVENSSSKFKKYIPFILILTGMLSFLTLLYYGNFNLTKIKENFSLIPALYVLNAISFIFMAYGISNFMEVFNGGFLWKFLSSFFSFSIIFLYFLFSYKNNFYNMRNENIIAHLPLLIPIFLAFLIKIFEKKFDFKKVKTITAILIFISAFQFITYKEIEMEANHSSNDLKMDQKIEKNEIQTTSKKSSVNRPVNKSKK